MPFKKVVLKTKAKTDQKKLDRVKKLIKTVLYTRNKLPKNWKKL